MFEDQSCGIRDSGGGWRVEGGGWRVEGGGLRDHLAYAIPHFGIKDYGGGCRD